MPNDNRPKLLCRLFGHRWKPAHILGRTAPYNLSAWIYTDDVCTRCHMTEYRLPSGYADSGEVKP